MARPYLRVRCPSPAAQREPAHAGRGNDATGDGQAEGVGGVVNVAPGAASPDSDGSGGGIDVHVADEREIDDQTIIADSQPSGVMSATPNRNQEAVLAPEVDRSNDIGYVGAACDQGGVPVDHAVVDLAGSLIALHRLVE